MTFANHVYFLCFFICELRLLTNETNVVLFW